MSKDIERAESLGYNLGDMAPTVLREFGEIARTMASLFSHDSGEFRAWIALSRRYEHAARLADADPRETHGFPGDDS